MIFYYHRGESLSIHHARNDIPESRQLTGVTGMHAHEDYEIYYFISGECSYNVEGNEYSLTPGSIMIMRPAEVHSLVINGRKRYERIAINFSAEILEATDPEHRLLEPFWGHALGEMNLYEPEDFGRSIDKYLYRAADPANAASPYEARLAIASGILALLYEIRTVYLLKKQEGQNRREKPEILDYINNNLCEDLSLDALGKRFFFSKSQLNRYFRGLTGTTVGEYVTAKRLLSAKERISSGSAAAKACRECGFRDYSTFYRAYKKKFGAPPKRGV